MSEPLFRYWLVVVGICPIVKHIKKLDSVCQAAISISRDARYHMHKATAIKAATWCIFVGEIFFSFRLPYLCWIIKDWSESYCNCSEQKLVTKVPGWGGISKKIPVLMSFNHVNKEMIMAREHMVREACRSQWGLGVVSAWFREFFVSELQLCFVVPIVTVLFLGLETWLGLELQKMCFSSWLRMQS